MVREGSSRVAPQTTTRQSLPSADHLRPQDIVQHGIAIAALHLSAQLFPKSDLEFTA